MIGCTQETRVDRTIRSMCSKHKHLLRFIEDQCTKNIPTDDSKCSHLVKIVKTTKTKFVFEWTAECFKAECQGGSPASALFTLSSILHPLFENSNSLIVFRFLYWVPWIYFFCCKVKPWQSSTAAQNLNLSSADARQQWLSIAGICSSLVLTSNVWYFALVQPPRLFWSNIFVRAWMKLVIQK